MKERALQPNTTLCGGKYKIVRMLKQGGFGITYLAIDQTFDDEEVAIKEFFLRGVTERVDVSQVSVSNGDSLTLFDAQRKKFKKEAKRLRKIHHPNVIRVRDLFDEAKKNVPSMIISGRHGNEIKCDQGGQSRPWAGRTEKRNRQRGRL